MTYTKQLNKLEKLRIQMLETLSEIDKMANKGKQYGIRDSVRITKKETFQSQYGDIAKLIKHIKQTS